MQGRYGDPAAYNMGYLFETENGIPKSWFIADTMDQAMALLNVVHLLNPSDPLYGRIIDSILRFDTTEEGYWIHDRFEGQPGATEPKQKKGIGPYTWGLLYGLEVFSILLPKDDKLQAVIDKSYSYMESSLEPGDVNRWGHHAWGTMAIAARLYPETVFPMRARVK